MAENEEHESAPILHLNSDAHNRPSIIELDLSSSHAENLQTAMQRSPTPPVDDDDSNVNYNVVKCDGCREEVQHPSS